MEIAGIFAKLEHLREQITTLFSLPNTEEDAELFQTADFTEEETLMNMDTQTLTLNQTAITVNVIATKNIRYSLEIILLLLFCLE